MYAKALGAVLLAATALPAAAASFDCAKASAPIEHRLCGNDTLGALDERIASAYADLIEAQPRAAFAETRRAQRAWLASRDSCLRQDDPDRCLTAMMKARAAQLEATRDAERKRLDSIVAAIPAGPAKAATQLLGYDGALASAWLVYLQRFEPAAGVDAATAQTRFERARASLRKSDAFAASVFDDAAADKNARPGYAQLLLLRMQIERIDGGDEGAHCFVFARQGELAYDAFGPLYGSTRDSFAPLCAPQGDLFELPAWKQLRAALAPTESQYGMSAGTIRFATFADWRVIELRATVSPLLYLQPALRKRYDGDAGSAIQGWSGEGLGDDGGDIQWSDAERRRALALLPQLRQATADWLQRNRQLTSEQAGKVASAIVDVWVIAHLQST